MASRWGGDKKQSKTLVQRQCGGPCFPSPLTWGPLGPPQCSQNAPLPPHRTHMTEAQSMWYSLGWGVLLRGSTER